VETLLSVRGEAQRTIPPDYVTLWSALSSTAAIVAYQAGLVRPGRPPNYLFIPRGETIQTVRIIADPAKLSFLSLQLATPV
jgi:hypothetical protein